jgi:hypothetical protein
MKVLLTSPPLHFIAYSPKSSVTVQVIPAITWHIPLTKATPVAHHNNGELMDLPMDRSGKDIMQLGAHATFATVHTLQHCIFSYCSCRYSPTCAIITFPNVGGNRILLQSYVSMRIVNWMFMRDGVQVKYKLQNTRTRSAATWPPLPLCYRPAVFFRHVRLIVLHSRKEKFRALFKDVTSVSLLLQIA